jgi:transcriptional regulator with XRE-family HTH domain
MSRKDATLASEIGARLKTIRDQNGWKQKDLAERLGITQAQLSKYESGKMMPTVDTLVDIYLELHLRWEELLPLHDSSRSRIAVDVDIRQLVRSIERLPVHYRNQAAEVLRLILSSAREEGAEGGVKSATAGAGTPKGVRR